MNKYDDSKKRIKIKIRPMKTEINNDDSVILEVDEDENKNEQKRIITKNENGIAKIIKLISKKKKAKE